MHPHTHIRARMARTTRETARMLKHPVFVLAVLGASIAEINLSHQHQQLDAMHHTKTELTKPVAKSHEDNNVIGLFHKNHQIFKHAVHKITQGNTPGAM
jgi:hypothetical protein